MWDLTDNNVKNKSFKTAIINMLKRLHEITLKEVKDSMKQCLSKQGWINLLIEWNYIFNGSNGDK